MMDYDGRTLDHGHPISSPCEPNGSGELKMPKKTLTTCMFVSFHFSSHEDVIFKETVQEGDELHSSRWSEGMLQYIKQTVRLAGSSGNDYPQVDTEGDSSSQRAIECT